MAGGLRSLIVRHTRPSRRHLIPELALRLVTPRCALWSAPEEDVPFKDPYWAFYWPGGQAVARYILDNRSIAENRRVLDLGCGCGAGAIAAAKMKARRVLANDVDSCAVVAAQINAEINKVSIETSTENLIGVNCDEFDTILVGDMFYDEDFANSLFKWLATLRGGKTTILVGDPGRHGLTAKRRKSFEPLATYDLPQESCAENHGFTQTTVWNFKS